VKDPAVLALAEGCTALAHLANDEPWILEIWGEFLKQIMVDFQFPPSMSMYFHLFFHSISSFWGVIHITTPLVFCSAWTFLCGAVVVCHVGTNFWRTSKQCKKNMTDPWCWYIYANMTGVY